MFCQTVWSPATRCLWRRGAADCRSLLDLSRGDPRLTAFLRGETVDAPGCSGWTAVAAEGVIAGFGKTVNGTLKNHYPKGLRLRG